MTVDELRKRLTDLPGDLPVVLSKDGEGNGFSPLADAEQAMYDAESTWAGERYDLEEVRLAQPHPEHYDPAPEGSVRALFLWPTN